MYLGEKLTIDLNNKDFFPDDFTYYSKKNPKNEICEHLTFSDKTAEEIIKEVAAGARKVFEFKDE